MFYSKHSNSELLQEHAKIINLNSENYSSKKHSFLVDLSTGKFLIKFFIIVYVSSFKINKSAKEVLV